MKALKIIGIIVLILIVGGLVAPAFMPKQLKVSDSIIVNAPAQYAFKQVNDLHNWESWSPWADMDTTMVVEYHDGGIGQDASYSWTSENMGDGSLKITESKASESITTAIDFGPMGTAKGSWTFEPTDEGTKVTWGFTGSESGYLGRYMNVFMKGPLQKQFKQGLSSLKTAAEQAAEEGHASPDIELTEKQLPVQKAIATMAKDVKIPDEMTSELFGENFLAITTFIQLNKNIEMSGQPYSRYHKWDEEAGLADIEFGIPVSGEMSATNDTTMQLVEIGGKVLENIYYGPYDENGPVYEKAYQYMEAKNIQPAGSPWEVYITDPGEEPDTSKWETRIYFPVE